MTSLVAALFVLCTPALACVPAHDARQVSTATQDAREKNCAHALFGSEPAGDAYIRSLSNRVRFDACMKAGGF